MATIPLPTNRAAVLRGAASALDRIEFFRRLFLVFALGSVLGVGAAIAIEHRADLARIALMAASALVLGWGWVLWHRRGAFPAWSVVLEGAVLVAFVLVMRDGSNWIGVCYPAVAYRAAFGTGRQVRMVTAALVVTYLLGIGLIGGLSDLMHPMELVYVAALVFAAFISSTLVEVLRRDAAQVAELQASREQLRESELRFRSVADCLREALLITDTEDRIILANARVRHVLGYEPREVIGRIAADLLLPKAQRNVFRDRMRRRLSGETELYEAQLLRKDGSTIYAEISASPYRDHAGNIIGTLGAISDISDRKRLEERLRQSMRLEAVGQLAGGVAHDFNNLLTVIKCHSELMLSDLPPAGPALGSVQEIDRAVDKGATLIQQLLAFSRKQMLQPRSLTLASAVMDAAPILNSLVRPDVELVLCPEEPGEVFADPMQIEQVLVALVRNATEAMPAGGRIVVETRTRVLDARDPRVVTNEVSAGRYSVLVVTDNGSGMSKDVLDRIFEPFFTTKEPGEGTGLGLSSIYGIVRQSGGFVDVQSAPGTGTTFRVYLPAAPWTADVAGAERPELQTT